MKPKVLIVEDDTAEAERLHSLLSQSRYQILVASSAAEALRLAAAQRPDTAVIDTSLPDQSGIEVLRQTRLDPSIRHMGVMLMNPAPEDADIFQGFCYHSDAHWQKPVDAEEFVRFVDLITPAEHEEHPRDRFAHMTFI